MKKNWMKSAALTLSCVSILTLSGGCSTRTVYVPFDPPTVLLEDCPQPVPHDDVLALIESGDRREAGTAYVRYRLQVAQAFDMCNADKAGLRAYVKAMQGVAE